MAKPSESMDQMEELTEVLSQHLGIARNRTFNELSPKGKGEAGRRLETLLNNVAEGALTPLMHFTLNGGHIRKLAEVKKLQGSILADYLGIHEERPVATMSEEDKKEVGNRLGNSLKEVTGGALIPLVNYLLSAEDFRKLSSLRGKSNVDADSSGNDVKKVEDSRDLDDDEAMAAAVADIPNWRKDRAVSSTEIQSMKAEMNRFQMRLKNVEDAHEGCSQKSTEVSSKKNLYDMGIKKQRQ